MCAHHVCLWCFVVIWLTQTYFAHVFNVSAGGHNATKVLIRQLWEHRYFEDKNQQQIDNYNNDMFNKQLHKHNGTISIFNEMDYDNLPNECIDVSNIFEIWIK